MQQLQQHQQPPPPPPQQQESAQRSWRKIELGVSFVVLSAIFALMPLYRFGSTAAMSSGSTDNPFNRPVSHRYDNPIRQISILGERNSGTRWTFDHLNECFGHVLKVEKRLVRYKHWFQYEDPKKYEQQTLVITQFRNPYDWLKAMERVPHHAPAHLRTKPNADVHAKESENDWKIFLTRPWTMDRPAADLEWKGSSNCQEDFAYGDIISCVKDPWPSSNFNHTIRYSEHQPFYEMRNDGSGKPYRNIMELRSDKIRNFLSVRNYKGVADAWVVQYEYLLNQGTQNLLRRIQEWTGVKPQCKPLPPQIKSLKKTRMISREFAKHVRLNLNWTAEAMIGYNIELVREDDPREW